MISIDVGIGTYIN